MITETRHSRKHLLHYEHHRRHHRRRHHTLDNTTLDKYNFICVPLHPDEPRIDSSSSHKNLTMTQPIKYSSSIPSVLPPSTITSTAGRRVRFKFDENDQNQTKINFNNNRHTLSSDDIRSSEKNRTHRVEFQIPIHKDINPWLNVDCSTSSSLPAKTRSLTSQKIDIKPINNNLMRPQGITPHVKAEINSPPPTNNDFNKNHSQWYRQMYDNLHKPPEIKQDYQQNSYKPTYTFPDNFEGDSDHMEDYIRKTASHSVDKDIRKISSSPVRTLTSNLKGQRTKSKQSNGHIEKVTRFEDSHLSPVGSTSTERIKINNDASPCMSSSVNINLQTNSNHISSSDNEQKLVYKKILRGGDIPLNGLQKSSNNDRGRHMGFLHLYIKLN